jgi:hypothetical protein
MSSTAQPRQGRGLTATSMRTTALLSTAWAARLIRAGRAASSGRGRRLCARPCCVLPSSQKNPRGPIGAEAAAVRAPLLFAANNKRQAIRTPHREFFGNTSKASLQCKTPPFSAPQGQRVKGVTKFLPAHHRRNKDARWAAAAAAPSFELRRQYGARLLYKTMNISRWTDQSLTAMKRGEKFAW